MGIRAAPAIGRRIYSAAAVTNASLSAVRKSASVMSVVKNSSATGTRSFMITLAGHSVLKVQSTMLPLAMASATLAEMGSSFSLVMPSTTGRKPNLFIR